MSERRASVKARDGGRRVFSTDAVAWIAQLGALGAGGVLILHGLLDGRWQPDEAAYAIELIVVAVVVIFVTLSWLLRLQARAAARLHPGADIVTAIANVQFETQLRAVAQSMGVAAPRVYSGSYYAVALSLTPSGLCLGLCGQRTSFASLRLCAQRSRWNGRTREYSCNRVSSYTLLLRGGRIQLTCCSYVRWHCALFH